MSGIFDPAIFDSAIFDVGVVAGGIPHKRKELRDERVVLRYRARTEEPVEVNWRKAKKLARTARVAALHGDARLGTALPVQFRDDEEEAMILLLAA